MNIEKHGTGIRIREHNASPIDHRSEAGWLREVLRERNERIRELEKALAEALEELKHWHGALQP